MAYLDMETYFDAVCRMIGQGQENVPVPMQGDSMRPFLRSADFAYLAALPEKIKKGDILLFLREKGQYTLLRVYKIRTDGVYLMLGDGGESPEEVSNHQLRAKVSFVRCGGTDCKPGSFRWWFFACPWRLFAPLAPSDCEAAGTVSEIRKPPGSERAGRFLHGERNDRLAAQLIDPLPGRGCPRRGWEWNAGGKVGCGCRNRLLKTESISKS